MTYLDLLIRIKDGTQPKYVLYNNEVYVWHGCNYDGIYNDEMHITDILDECNMPTKNCIWEMKVEKDEESEGKTLGDIIAEKCF